MYYLANQYNSHNNIIMDININMDMNKSDNKMIDDISDKKEIIDIINQLDKLNITDPAELWSILRNSLIRSTH